VNGDFRADVSIELRHVHVGSVLEVSRKSMVLADEGVKDFSKVNVGVLITSVDTAVLNMIGTNG
jgi:hypothetical protein